MFVFREVLIIFFDYRNAGNEGTLAKGMEPPGWACAQTLGANLVR